VRWGIKALGRNFKLCIKTDMQENTNFDRVTVLCEELCVMIELSGRINTLFFGTRILGYKRERLLALV
jgi:hypothetical protein